MTTPTPSLSKSVKSNSLMFDGSKFEKQDVVLRNIIDELQLKILLKQIHIPTQEPYIPGISSLPKAQNES